MDTTKNIVESAVEHAASGQVPIEVPEGFNGKPVLILPPNYQIRLPDWEPEKPVRIKQTFRTADVGSFVRYLKDFGDPMVAMIYADVSDTGATVTGIIDAHPQTSEADWQSHRTVLTPKTATEWNRWVGVNGKIFTQVEFAQFVENNILDILTPNGADLLTICNEFEVEGAVQFQKIQRLQDGTVRFTYNDTKTASARGMAVPELFTIRARVFEGTDPVAVTARFRYRLKQNGELALWFELVNPHLHVRQSIDGMVATIVKENIGTVLFGTVGN